MPLLRKDFIIDTYQVFEARAAGADAILLILAALSDREVEPLASAAAELGMDILWEVHDREEMRRLEAFSPRVVGINNRDLPSSSWYAFFSFSISSLALSPLVLTV